MNKEKSLIEESNSLKERLKYFENGLINSRKDLKEYYNGGKIKKWNCEKWVIDLRKESILKAEKGIIKTKEEIKEIENKINLILKYFNQNMNPKTKGMVLKLLNKEYNNKFNNNGLKGYTVKLYKLINYAIENNIDFYLQFKTLENECIKGYNEVLKEWL